MSGRWELREKGSGNFMYATYAADDDDARVAFGRLGMQPREEGQEAVYEMVCYHATTGAVSMPVDW